MKKSPSECFEMLNDLFGNNAFEWLKQDAMKYEQVKTEQNADRSS